MSYTESPVYLIIDINAAKVNQTDVIDLVKRKCAAYRQEMVVDATVGENAE